MGEQEITNDFAKECIKSFYQVLGLAIGKEQYHDFLMTMDETINDLMIIEAMPRISVHEKQVRALEVDSSLDVVGEWDFPIFDGVVYDAESPAVGDTPTAGRESVTRGKNSIRKKHTRSRNAE